MEPAAELLIIGDGPGAAEALAAAAARGLTVARARPRDADSDATTVAGWPWPFVAAPPPVEEPALPRAFLGGGGGVFVEGPAGLRPVRPRRTLLVPRLRPARPSWWEGPARVTRPEEAAAARVVVIGGGQTGVEAAAAWAAAGREVLLVESAERLLPGWDADQALVAREALEALGVAVQAGRRAVACAAGPDGFRVVLRAGGGSPDRAERADLVMPALGWRPVLGGCGLERTRALVDRHGLVEVDSRCRTAEPGLYAIAAALALPLSPLAAARQAELVAAVAAGREPPPLRHARLPRLIRRPVPLLAAGLSVAGAAARGIRAGSGTARAAGGNWARCVTDLETGDLIGVQAAGPLAADLGPAVESALGSGSVSGAGSSGDGDALPPLLAAALAAGAAKGAADG